MCIRDRYLRDNGEDIGIVNLDPGARRTPYSPDIDVREWIDYNEVVREFDLGPNGALIYCVDRIVDHIEELRESLESGGWEIVLIDTPGQFELYVLRDSGPAIVEELSSVGKQVGLFLMSVVSSNTLNELVIQLALSMLSQARLSIPHYRLLSKADLASKEEIEKILDTVENLEGLEYALEPGGWGKEADLILAMMRMLVESGLSTELIPVSIYTLEGFRQIYQLLDRERGGL